MLLIKSELLELLKNAVEQVVRENNLPAEILDRPITLEVPKMPEHGDFATTFALAAAKQARINPRELAQKILDRLPIGQEPLKSAELAGPGFINLRIADASLARGLRRVLDAGDDWGRGAPVSGRINLEFVSANPTGPMHVGHGRGAAVGDSLARILRFAGREVFTEYYVNDAGRQVSHLAASIWSRYIDLCREQDATIEAVPFPEDGYHGGYVVDFARSYLDRFGLAPALAGYDAAAMKAFGVELALAEIRTTLDQFNVHFDVFTSEATLHDDGAVTRAMDLLGEKGLTYEQEGALFFAATRFGDEKDRVMIRANGEPTYFAADIAYHLHKFNRGFDQLMDIWGADHHGYISRVKCALEAFGYRQDQLAVLLVQFVSLVNQGEKLAMGKRSGNFVTLQDLIDTVSCDVTRWFFLAKTHDVAVDFDLEVATSADPRENQARYVQYGHARACAIWRRAAMWNLTVADLSAADFTRLAATEEQAIARMLLSYPELVADAAANFLPHRVASYALDLCRAFHSYYTRFKDDPILPRSGQEIADRAKTIDRLGLVEAYRTVLRSCLSLLGITAPEAMTAPEEE
ncbi:arginine--tRNA ligase [Myxococcota bacterium]|nr:arginine--tRNA ligase [Myxococcota bacterium]